MGVRVGGTYNFANEVEQLSRTDPGAGVVQLPFAYDDAGNMKEKALTGTAWLIYTHDAWNRLVKVERDSSFGSGPPISIAEYEYNGLHQRILKRVDTSAPGTLGYGTLDQQHEYYYTAAWQIAVELIDENWAAIGPNSIDQVIERVWGARYIDDIILTRVDEDNNGGFDETWYHVTDHQFSTVALLDNAANLVERVSYDAYGLARHHWTADLTGDGAVGTADQNAMRAATGKSIGDNDYHVDADITRTGTVTSSDSPWTATVNFKAALPKGDLSAPGVGNVIGYCGYVFNAEVPTSGGAGGLYTVRFRHYDPALGRWLERDPLGYVDGMSLYEYARGNSVNAFDPFGLWCREYYGPQIVDEPIESPYYGPHVAPPQVERPYVEPLEDPVTEFRKARGEDGGWANGVIIVVGGVLGVLVVEAASWIIPGGKIIQATAKFIKVLKGGKVYTYVVKARKAPGRDGGQSVVLIEKVDGETRSVIHQVIKDGKVIHQHQEHVGKYGTRRTFPDEWNDFPTIK